ncbi:phage regulatory protein/antirepressor Ant [Paraburkholderia sp. BCC1876]|uniref:phage regulatory protein/antirepressor Ant n=1 Tax=Paraburkholderia sp. BCC1876 TaxID=2676303 RepID=UPI001FC7E648|nr:phage regulatory protein/antirepressor Ant [Paraburkholderia sp. BCC1876]
MVSNQIAEVRAGHGYLDVATKVVTSELCRVSEHGEIVTDSLVIAEEFGRAHKNVLASLDGLIERGRLGGLDFKLTSYTDNSNRQKRMIELSERGAMIAMPFIGGTKSEEGQVRLVSAFISMRERVHALEHAKAAAVKLPNAKELAMLVIAESDRADAAEQRAEDEQRRAIRAEARADLLSGKVDELLPAAHALDDLVATPGSECGTDAAKTLGVSPKWLFLYMQSIEWIYKRGVRSGGQAASIPWTMTDEAWKAGYVERNVGHREARKPNGSVVFLPTNTVYVTREGLKELAKRIAVLRADGKELPTTLELIQSHLSRVDAQKKAKRGK